MKETQFHSLLTALDNISLWRMEKDVVLLEKRLGFAEKKRNDLEGSKKWWKLLEAKKDPRRGTDPLAERLREKSRAYASLEEKMKKEGEEVFFDDSRMFKRKLEKIGRGDFGKAKTLLLLAYVRFVQSAYPQGLPLEKSGEDLTELEEGLFEKAKEGEDFLARLKRSFCVISSLPKAEKEEAGRSLSVLLSALGTRLSFDGADDWRKALGLEGHPASFDGLDYASSCFFLALVLSLSFALKGESVRDDFRREMSELFLEQSSLVARKVFVEKKDLSNGRRTVKAFHRFEDLLLEEIG